MSIATARDKYYQERLAKTNLINAKARFCGIHGSWWEKYAMSIIILS